MQPFFFFWPCDEKKEIKTSSDKRNDRKKTQKGKAERKEVGWTNKVVKSKRVTDALNATRERGAWKVMVAHATEKGA